MVLWVSGSHGSDTPGNLTVICHSAQWTQHPWIRHCLPTVVYRDDVDSFSHPGSCLNINTIFPGIGIFIIKIRRPWDCLSLIMEIPVPKVGIFILKLAQRYYCRGRDDWFILQCADRYTKVNRILPKGLYGHFCWKFIKATYIFLWVYLIKWKVNVPYSCNVMFRNSTFMKSSWSIIAVFNHWSKITYGWGSTARSRFKTVRCNTILHTARLR